jgi:hypothetical protein
MTNVTSDKTDPIEILLERRTAIQNDLKTSKTALADANARMKRAIEESLLYTTQISTLNEALAKLGYVEPGQEAHAP